MHSRVLAERNYIAQQEIDQSIQKIAAALDIKNLPSKQFSRNPVVNALFEREYFATVLKMIAGDEPAPDPEPEPETPEETLEETPETVEGEPDPQPEPETDQPASEDEPEGEPDLKEDPLPPPVVEDEPEEKPKRGRKPKTQE